MKEACLLSYRRYWLAALFLGTMVGFAAYRKSSFAVWNDSASIFHPLSSSESVPNWDELKDRFCRAPLSALGPCLKDCFLSPESGGYRPLSTLWIYLASMFFHTTSYLPLPLLLIVGFWLGALVVSLFHVARRFVRYDLTALGVVLLVLGSPPLVASSWVCVAGVQILVPLLFCLSLLCYWNLVEGSHRLWNALAMLLLLLLGPWVREFFGLNALLLVILELRRTRRPTWIMGAASLGFLHALFPTALIHWLFLPQLPLLPVYKLGTLSGTLGNGGIRWGAGWHFLPLFPPSLWVCAALEVLVRLRGGCASADKQRNDWFGRVETAVRTLAIPVWLLIVLALLAQEPYYRGYLGAALSMGVAVLGMRRDLGLGVWFVLMYAPILRVFTEHVHFLYAIPPGAIILAESMESLWRRLSAWPTLARLRYALAILLVVIGIDQTLNIYGAYRVNRAAYGGIDVVADWFLRHVPEGSAVVTNALHGEEIKWHSGNHIEIYWTIAAGVCDPRRAVDKPSRLEEILTQRAQHPVYFLDVDFDYPQNKGAYHRHKYVHEAEIDSKDLGVVYFSHVRYPFTDPLRYLIPRMYQPFLGAPDLENDFARKCSVDHLFHNEIYAIYHVYEVTGDRLSTRNIISPSRSSAGAIPIPIAVRRFVLGKSMDDAWSNGAKPRSGTEDR
ncbi:MAG: hypothetical protein ACYC3I_09530 [Gemmataceae bacterium]